MDTPTCNVAQTFPRKKASGPWYHSNGKRGSCSDREAGRDVGNGRESKAVQPVWCCKAHPGFSGPSRSNRWGGPWSLLFDWPTDTKHSSPPERWRAIPASSWGHPTPTLGCHRPSHTRRLAKAQVRRRREPLMETFAFAEAPVRNCSTHRGTACRYPRVKGPWGLLQLQSHFLHLDRCDDHSGRASHQVPLCL